MLPHLLGGPTTAAPFASTGSRFHAERLVRVPATLRQPLGPIVIGDTGRTTGKPSVIGIREELPTRELIPNEPRNRIALIAFTKTATPPRRGAAPVHAPRSGPGHEPLGSWCYQLTQTPPSIFHRGESL